MLLDKSFFERDTLTVAQQLIGCHLVRRIDDQIIRVAITETEAYKGSEDPASHASRGVTERNRLMFGDAGIMYVYFIYGMHCCMNIVAHRPNEVGAVLLRGGEVVEGIGLIRANRGEGIADHLLLNGPGKLAKALGINLEWNGYDLLQETHNSIWLEYKEPIRPIRSTPRIGISKAVDLPWRYLYE
ncbi:DNA-3-methyladenine glycosylase [Paenibacillus prosopidis]|uniref:Putative 3-methyladenine DNA glycosylase n=1 Tax=Paenibacillus prosopidis TaxID=630520 RepID=A0A368VL99_9BACL|nr:DNA-3-methyladenine glycosylase [Paenibacillus prosopidis]RCW42298.1 DNA-3-methyladenine glycosylase [Paenibacillus prosopidis]